MEKSVNLSEELKKAELKKENLSKTFDLVHANTSSVLMFSLQWKDLEEHLESTMKLLEKQTQEVDMNKRLLNQRAKEIETKEAELITVQKRVERKKKELGFVKKRIQECTGELELTEKGLSLEKEKLGLVRKRVRECSEELELKKKELGLKEKEVEDCYLKIKLGEEKWVEVEKSIKDCANDVELKRGELSELERELKKCCEEISKKDEELQMKKALVDECRLELDSVEVEFDTVKNMVREKEDEIDLQEKQLESLQGLIRDCSEQLLWKDKELSRIQNLIKEASEKFAAKEKEIASIQVLVEDFMEELDVKEKQYDEMKKSVEECDALLKTKREELKLIETAIETKKEEFNSLEQSVLRCSEELESGKKQLNSVQNYMESLSDQRDANELQLDLNRTMAHEYLLDLKKKEEHLRLLEETLKKRSQDIEAKEMRFEEYVNKAKFRDSPPRLRARGNGKILQSFLMEYITKHELVFNEIRNNIITATDPAKIVLEAMDGFFPQQGQVEFDGNIRRCCMLLLDILYNLSPQINPQVRDEALKVANEWKVKMKATVEGSSEVLGFLQLIVSFRLGSYYSKNELQSLLNIISHHKQASILRQALGVTIEVPATDNKTVREGGPQFSNTMDGRNSNLSISERLEASLLEKSEVSAALQMTADPAKFVLDLIQLSYSEEKKKEHLFPNLMKNYILLLAQLSELLPKINPRVKAEAISLAADLKPRLGAETDNFLAVTCYLKFLTTYDLVNSFSKEEISPLLLTLAQYKWAPEICRSLGFANMVPDIVRDLIERRQYMEAIRFICAFKLMDKVQLDAFLKKYLETIARSACNFYREGKNKAIDLEVSALKNLSECVEYYHQESSLSARRIKRKISQLQKQKLDQSHLAPTLSPVCEFQMQVGEDHNIGSLAYPLEPTALNLNSRDWVQTLDKCKRPRLNPTTLEAIPTQIPSYGNPFAIPSNGRFGLAMTANWSDGMFGLDGNLRLEGVANLEAMLKSAAGNKSLVRQ